MTLRFVFSACFFFFRGRRRPYGLAYFEVLAITYQPKSAETKQTTVMTAIPSHPELAMGSGIFIPKKLVINVGIARTIEMIVMRFMTIARLFEMSEPQASVI